MPPPHLPPIAISLLIGAVTALPVVPLTLTLLRGLGHERANFEGKRLVNSGGLACVPSILIALLAAHARYIGPAVSVALGFCILGLADDLWGDRSAGGLRGHFRLLAQGRVTTGAVKAIGGAALALAVAAARAWPPPVGLAGWLARVLLHAALIALTANAINLLDLRPLRALKGFVLPALGVFLWSAITAPRSAEAAALGALLGAALVYAPFEARRCVMLGDAGSNLLGAALGLAAGRLPLPAQIAWLAAVIALHVYAERASISAWIEAHPWARAIDRWGWGGLEEGREGR